MSSVSFWHHGINQVLYFICALFALVQCLKLRVDTVTVYQKLASTQLDDAMSMSTNLFAWMKAKARPFC